MKILLTCVLIVMCSISLGEAARLRMKTHKLTCKNYKVVGTVISANCQRADQFTWINTSIDLNTCYSLRSRKKAVELVAMGSGTLATSSCKGSYTLANDRFDGTCSDCDGNPFTFSIDISKNVHNIDGTLKCFS